MRSYTNSEGMSVTVTKGHLDKAVDIKLELQELSQSRRCNWSKHKRIMIEAGYDDSDNNESYRCMIKAYQKEVNRLHSLPKYADMVSTSKIEAIRNLVHEERFERMANQDILREITKYKRELTRTAVLAEELRNTIIDDVDFTVPHYIYNSKIVRESKNKGILIITDWHIGMTIDNCYGNSYNYEIANKRIDKLIQEAIGYCELYNITSLNVIGLGDWIEHIYMRKNQSQDCEFSLSMQIAKATKLIFKVIISLSEYVNVTYGGIAGNHDRGHGDKNQSFDDDNANVVITEGIKDLINLVDTDRITLLDLDGTEEEINLELNGKKLKFTHGHNEWGKKKDKIKDFISMSEEFFDIWVHGHLHNFYIQEDDHSRMIVGIGSLQGRNSYAKALGSATDASQAFIVIREDGEVLPLRIGLQVQ